MRVQSMPQLDQLAATRLTRNTLATCQVFREKRKIGSSMFRVFSCLTGEHDWRLVVLAGLVCLLSSLVAVSLFHRARGARGGARSAQARPLLAGPAPAGA